MLQKEEELFKEVGGVGSLVLTFWSRRSVHLVPRSVARATILEEDVLDRRLLLSHHQLSHGDARGDTEEPLEVNKTVTKTELFGRSVCFYY